MVCRAKITPQMETMLLTHMFALCLRLDDYATDSTLLAKDLSMSVAKYVFSSSRLSTDMHPATTEMVHFYPYASGPVPWSVIAGGCCA